ncbi:glycosyltransferase family 2 protein [Pelomonas sp. P7]|uniref:Glycosyltransferase family 2 protein n=1 Tax=Pelomonas caseinilytica TaxID=2906763 RepID=A0ABS8XGM4_9BURK|nr:glycosyltransferase family 2 protein [Pelomonas sp. P7]MCE4538158.1 glycosyltransferase family 2 protein [Pelomonas sp. P7]
MSTGKPRISVCIATYNGQLYVEEQLRSILAQLGCEDEVILSDDGSKDATVQTVRDIGDPRVHVLPCGPNLGHVRNFERALKAASGDVIFLSDQDDVWAPEKVREVMAALAAHPRVQMVHHALTTMDEAGRTLDPRWNSVEEGEFRGAAFLAAQCVRCRVFGCAVALRRSLLDILLPFPASVYAHDHWLTVAAAAADGLYQLDKPLVRYRQHRHNVTPKNGLGWQRRIAVRIDMLRMIAAAVSRVRAARRIQSKDST